MRRCVGVVMVVAAGCSAAAEQPARSKAAAALALAGTPGPAPEAAPPPRAAGPLTPEAAREAAIKTGRPLVLTAGPGPVTPVPGAVVAAVPPCAELPAGGVTVLFPLAGQLWPERVFRAGATPAQIEAAVRDAGRKSVPARPPMNWD